MSRCCFFRCLAKIPNPPTDTPLLARSKCLQKIMQLKKLVLCSTRIFKLGSSTEKLIVLICQPKFITSDLIINLLPLSHIEEAVCKDSCRSITLCNSWKKIWQTTNKKFSITPPYVIVHLLSEENNMMYDKNGLILISILIFYWLPERALVKKNIGSV